MHTHTPQEKVYVNSIRNNYISFLVLSSSRVKEELGARYVVKFQLNSHCVVYNVTRQIFTRYINCKEWVIKMKEMTVTNYSCFYNQNSFEFFMKLCSINTCIMSINPYMTGNVSSCLKSRLGTYYSCASQSQLHPQQCVWPNLLGTKI